MPPFVQHTEMCLCDCVEAMCVCFFVAFFANSIHLKLCRRWTFIKSQEILIQLQRCAYESNENPLATAQHISRITLPHHNTKSHTHNIHGDCLHSQYAFSCMFSDFSNWKRLLMFGCCLFFSSFSLFVFLVIALKLPCKIWFMCMMNGCGRLSLALSYFVCVHSNYSHESHQVENGLCIFCHASFQHVLDRTTCSCIMRLQICRTDFALRISFP